MTGDPPVPDGLPRPGPAGYPNPCTGLRAQLLSQEQDDGLIEYDYWLADSREFVEVIANPTSSQVLCVTYELRNDEGGASVDISEADAQAQVLALCQEALHG